LRRAQRESENAQWAAKVDEIDAAHLEHRIAFKKVSELMRTREKGVTEVLDIQGPRMQKMLTEIMDSSYDDSNIVGAFYSGRALRHLLLGRLHVAKFFDTNDQAALGRVSEEFGEMQEQLDILKGELKDADHHERLLKILEAKDVYTRTFDSLVRVISDRNNLIEGKLERLATRIATNAEEVTSSLMGAQDELGPTLVAANRIIFCFCIRSHGL